VDLSGKLFGKLPDLLQFAMHCEVLDLSRNNLMYLPAWLGKLNASKIILSPGNPLSLMPKSLSLSVPQLKDYLSEFQYRNGTSSWHQTKVVVLGKEGVGKTHLIHKLQKQRYPRNVSTDGIHVEQFKFGQHMVSCYDFGGQMIFYSTHQFFLTCNSIYVVVFSLADESFLERVDYWIHILKAFVKGYPKPRVLLVGTFLDKIDSKKLEGKKHRFFDFFFCRLFLSIL
jgi:hypothetical protein